MDEAGNALQRLGRDETPLAKYLLLFMVKGITSDLAMPFAHYATDGVTSDLLYVLLWQAVRALQIDLGLNVLFITCDGASANRRFFRLHADNEHVHYTKNPYSDCNIYFISDVPHLLKTARNCFSNSHAHKNSRSLWRNGQTISWMHIVDLYEHHCSGILRLCPKLSHAHIHLTSFSLMNVRLAAQVMSKTVADGLEITYGQTVAETVGFIRVINKFFDVLNVKDLTESQKKRNSDLAPYRDADDERLQWLLGEFLEYFEEWKRSVERREGDFTKSAKAAMQLSYQTLDGLEISARSIVACVKFMLNIGADFVLTRCFNQDKIEQFFGMLRMKGGANDNPTVNLANHMINQLRFVRTQQFENVRGNIHGQVQAHVDQEALLRRRR